ncbi:MAG: TonB-dependent receptor [Muribaculaceae bacterium]|nr:TonB-dependent receptor [Muribaculaceae bacterium]
MKRFLTAALLVTAFAPAARAEGYQINTLSARQNGMGHTGVALHLGSESQIFNPAGLTYLNDNVELTGSLTGIFATASATLPDGTRYSTDNSPSTPMSATAGFSIYDNFKAGVAFYTPYGSGINWTDSWPGAVLNQSVSLKTFTLQPTLAWSPLKGLSVGAGLMLTWGNVNLDKGLVEPSSFNTMQQLLIGMGMLPAGAYQPYGPTTIPASINLTGKANVAVGVNVGVMYDITEQWTVGASFRSRMNMNVKAGTASLKFANTHAENILDNRLGLLNQSQFKASMPCPEVWKFGVAYRPVKGLVVALDAQLTGWSAYKALDINFLDEALASYDQHIEKNYKNSWTFSAGAQYALTPRFDLRCGLMVDTSPVSASHYNPETPGMTKINPSVGFSFRPIDAISIDASFLYVAGLGADNRSCTYPDILLTALGGTPVGKTFTADYHVHAFNPSIGVTARF